jgi:hypothetical protein
MRPLIAVFFGILALAGTIPVDRGGARADDPPSCAVPEYLLFTDHKLKRVFAAGTKENRLTIAVVGTGSSILGGTDGPSFAYPARLMAALNERLPSLEVKLVTRVKSAQTADEMRRGMRRLVAEEKPDLVIWQTGTVDAMRRISPEDFKAALDSGVEALQSGGSDVILMDMQFSPRTETMIAVGPYVENMRASAQQHGIPMFDRFAIMRYWSDHGAFDFYATGRDSGLARRVHDCLGRAIASIVIEGGRLQALERKAGQ